MYSLLTVLGLNTKNRITETLHFTFRSVFTPTHAKIMKKYIKLSVFIFYLIILICMAVATVIEKYQGTDYTGTHIYGAWWFTLLWALLAVAAIVYYVQMRVRRCSVVLLHTSFVVILAGAFITHVSAERGMIHLYIGETSGKYMVADKRQGMKEKQLPFQLKLNNFNIVYHNGTKAEQDYESNLTVIDNGKRENTVVSMNKILNYRSYRFYQSSYDPDKRGSVLSINADPYGIPVTYTGYGLLFVALLWMLIDPKGAYRRVLRSDIMKKGVICLTAFLAFGQTAQATTALPKETAKQMGELYILYNNRICPLQTFAIDFTKKLYGKAHYGDYTAEQVLTGFIFWPDEWSNEPIIKVKSGDMKTSLQLPDYASVGTFFDNSMGGYRIGPYLQEYYNGNHDAFHTQCADMDDRLQLVMDLRQGNILKVFPVTVKGNTTWYAPSDDLHGLPVDANHAAFMHNVFGLIYEQATQGNYAMVGQVVNKMQKYQLRNGGHSLPSGTQVAAERLYNGFPFATILFMVNLTMGFLTLLVALYKLTHCTGKQTRQTTTVQLIDRWAMPVSATVMVLSLAALTFGLALRWIISGTVPMANGYETMLFMAWLIMIVSLVACRRFHILITFGFLMSGFFLLVSHINQMNPQITHVMPVLNSPLLSIHVSIIMLSFALLSLTFICGVMGLLIRAIRGKYAVQLHDQLESLRLLSDLFLYPALATLGIGIFIGAIWANVSWGTYWGWDAKEVWGLITFMIYAMSVHRTTLPFLRKPLGYHVFMTLAFLAILMTYFGVNYFLGGMHSYA